MRHLFLAISLVGLAVAIIAFINNQAIRNDVRTALGFKTPEEQVIWGYDQRYLQSVADKLRAAPAGPGATLLDRYRRPALLWNDVAFAIALGIFSASMMVWLLTQFAPSGFWRCLIVAMAVSSLLYAVFDTAEDLVLEHALATPDAISRRETLTASVLTRLKALSIVGSGAGGIAYLVLQLAVPRDAKPLLAG